ncbi:MAG: holo-ACP synthase [Candidatus Melainabacteria bacterium]|nr:holo-ACP synthase [Candidatus Melainabacteria bacterium]
MIRIGTDICSIERISSAYDRFGSRFLGRILTASETEYVVSQPAQLASRLAGRFAAKEAAAKALGTGWRGVAWREIEIIHNASGAPGLRLHGRAETLAESRGLKCWEVSVSHDRDYATAFVLAYGNAEQNAAYP